MTAVSEQNKNERGTNRDVEMKAKTSLKLRDLDYRFECNATCCGQLLEFSRVK